MAAQDTPRKDQRNKTFVDKVVQGKFVRRLLGHWIIYLTCSSLLAIMLKWMMDPFRPFEAVTSDFFAGHAPTLIIALLLLPVFARDTLKLTHKFAGPMLRVRRAMNELANSGHAERITFRPGDFWHNVAVEFNEMCDRVEPVLGGQNEHVPNA